MSLIGSCLVGKLLGRSEREDCPMTKNLLSSVSKTWLQTISFNFLRVTEEVTGGGLKTNMIPIITLIGLISSIPFLIYIRLILQTSIPFIFHFLTIRYMCVPSGHSRIDFASQ